MKEKKMNEARLTHAVNASSEALARTHGNRQLINNALDKITDLQARTARLRAAVEHVLSPTRQFNQFTNTHKSSMAVDAMKQIQDAILEHLGVTPVKYPERIVLEEIKQAKEGQ